MFGYWNTWRRAYHQGRVTYHQIMAQFYDEQVQIQQRFIERWLDYWYNILNPKPKDAVTSSFDLMKQGLDLWKK